MNKIVELKGSVLIMPGRKPWHLFKFGWYRFETISGPAWVRFNWPESLQPPDFSKVPAGDVQKSMTERFNKGMKK